MGCEECIHANGDQALSTHHFIKSPEVGTTILSIFQMREQWHRELKAFLWRHTANKGQSHTHKRLQWFCFWHLPFGKYHIPFPASKCNPSFEQLLGLAHLSPFHRQDNKGSWSRLTHSHLQSQDGTLSLSEFSFFFFWQHCNMQNLSSSVWDRTHVPSSGNSRVLSNRPPGNFRVFI